MPELSVLLVKVGVNMGDHGETVTTAVHVDQWETVGSMVDRLLSDTKYVMTDSGSPGHFKSVPQPEWRLEIRTVAPIEGGE